MGFFFVGVGIHVSVPASIDRKYSLQMCWRIAGNCPTSDSINRQEGGGLK